MKTAISVPDQVFEAAEAYAKDQQMSRSQLYTEAISEYLARHTDDHITAAYNATIDQINDVDNALADAAARQTLANTEW